MLLDIFILTDTGLWFQDGIYVLEYTTRVHGDGPFVSVPVFLVPTVEKTGGQTRKDRPFVSPRKDRPFVSTPFFSILKIRQ